MNRKQIVFALFIKGIIAIMIGTHLKLNGNEMYFIAISTGVIFQILSLIFYFKPKRKII